MKKWLIIQFVFLITYSGFGQNNPICNPGFENDYTDWILNTNNGAVTHDIVTGVDTVFSGSKSHRSIVTTAHNNANNILSCNQISLEQGNYYHITFWAKTQEDFGEIKLSVMVEGSALYTSTQEINSTEWAYFKVNYFPEEDYPSASIRIAFVDTAVYYLDDLNIKEITSEPIVYLCDTAVSSIANGPILVKNSYGLTNYLEPDTSTMYYCDALFSEENGGGYYLHYRDQAGNSSGMDAYPDVVIGSLKDGVTYIPGDIRTVGMPDKLENLPPSMYFEWITSQEYALDKDDKWMASINFIFDAHGTATSEPDPALRDFDLVIKSQSHNFADELNDIDISDPRGTSFWYFARYESGALRPYEYIFEGTTYTYAVRYKFFTGAGDKDDKVHVKLIPYGPAGAPAITQLNVPDLIEVCRTYYDYAALPPEQRALADEKVAPEGMWLKSINAGYEVYNGEAMLSTDRFKVGFGKIDTLSACNSYTWENGETYTETGHYQDTLSDINGNDSIANLYLIIIDSINTSVTQLANVLKADQDNLHYQWLDCDNDFMAIDGETNQVYEATSSGSYAVEIQTNNCVDTSHCQIVSEIDVTNKICNYGFEDDLNDWVTNTNGGAVVFTADSTDVYDGDKALNAAVNTYDDFRNWIKTCQFGLTENHTYKVSFWIKTNADTTTVIKVTLRDEKGEANTYTVNMDIDGNEWKQYSITYVADKDYTGMVSRFSFIDPVDYLMDEVVLEDITYFDCNGDIDGTAYIDNCDECVGGNTGKVSTCKETEFTGVSRIIDEPFYGFNVVSYSDEGNFRNDTNVLHVWEKTHAKIYRYAGGTYGNYYDWTTGTTIAGGSPGETDLPIRPYDLVNALPDDTEILWMVQVRMPLPSYGYDWTTMNEAELLSQNVLDNKIQSILEGLDAFKSAGKEVRYMELGNEFFFGTDDEKAGGSIGPIGDGGDGSGSHFPYLDPNNYASHMAQICRAVKQSYPNIEIVLLMGYGDLSNKVTEWNEPILEALEANPQFMNDISGTTSHWYQSEVFYDDQSGPLPPIADVASTQTAFGFAFDYVEHKKNVAFNGKVVPPGKELWITEGYMQDQSAANTWVDGLREGVTKMYYLLMEDIAMYTPQKFQNFYMAPNLKLTPRGKVASMIYAATQEMTLVEELNLGGNLFEGEFGGPYPELIGMKYSNGDGNERLVLMNCSENTYSNLNMSTLISGTGLHAYQRYNAEAWESEKADEEISAFTKDSVNLQPYSITLVSEKELIDKLVEYDLIVRNPTGTYPDNYIKHFDFGTDYVAGEKITQVLEVKNDGDAAITLSDPPLSLSQGINFSIMQPDTLTLAPGESSPFSLFFSPNSIGSFNDTLTVLMADGKKLTMFITGTANSDLNDLNNILENGDYELGIDSGWSVVLGTNGDANYNPAASSDIYKGDYSAMVQVLSESESSNLSDVRLRYDKLPVPAGIAEIPISFFAKTENGLGKIFAYVFFYDAEGTKIDGSFSSPTWTPLNYYTKYSFMVTVPPNAVTFQFEFRCGQKNDLYFFDDVFLINNNTSGSNDATLMDLLSNGVTVEGFAPDILSYIVNLPVSTIDIPILSAVPNDSNATVVIDQALSLTGQAIATVTAEDDSTQLVYTVNYSVLLNDDATLAEITVNGLMLPNFSPDVLNYQFELAHDDYNIPTVTAMATDSNATVVITNPTEVPGISNIEVRAEDDTTQLVYTISFTVAPDDDATLSSIAVNDSVLSNFHPDTLSYAFELDYGYSAIPEVVGTPNDSNATVDVTNPTEIPGTTEIIVTAEDDSTLLVYEVNFTVALNDDASLSSILVNDSLLPGFSPDSLTYFYTLEQGEAIPEVTGIPNDSNATVNVFDAMELPGVTYLLVEAEDDTTRLLYSVVFRVAKNDDATLASIVVNDSILPDFHPDSLSYDYVLDQDDYSIPEVIGIPNDSNATVMVFDATTIPGTTAILVIAENRDTFLVYEINFSVEKSSDATLSSLSVNDSILPNFHPDSLSYKFVLEHDDYSVPEVIGIPNDSNATVLVNDAVAIPGTTQVIVTAEDGITQLIYEVNFTVEPDNDATLASILVNGSELPNFTPETYSYSYILESDETPVPVVVGIPNDTNANVIVIDAAQVPGTTTIVVVAEDRTTVLAYDVVFSVLQNNDASLSAITVNDSMIPGFSPGIYSYDFVLEHDDYSIPAVVAIPNDSNATVVVTDPAEIPGTTQINVTAQDDSTQLLYEVNFSVAPDNDATLSSIIINDSLLPGFDPNIFSYSFGLENDSLMPQIVATPSDSNATVTIEYPSGIPGTAKITVLAEDNITSLAYEIQFYLEGNDIATLNTILVNGVSIPGFNPNTLIYNYELEQDVIPEVVGIPTDQNAMVSIINPTEIPGTTQLLVTATDSATQLEYQVNFTVKLNDDATLSSILIDGSPLPNFNPDIYSYNFELAHDYSLVPKVTGIPSDSNATVIELDTELIPGTAQIVVIAEDNSILRYEVSFTIAKSTEATLKDILVNNVSIPNFSPDVYSYTYELEMDENTVPDVMGIANDTNAFVVVEDASGIPGTTEIFVLAEDETTLLIYEVNFIVPVSNDATLANIFINDSELPGFSPDIYSYQYVLEPNDYSIPKVIGIPNDSNATVVVVDANQIPGTTQLTVTAEDGITQLTYEVSFSVAPNNDATLANILVNDSMLPGFDPSVYTYNYELEKGNYMVPDVLGIPSDTNATVTVLDAIEIPGTTQIVVIAEDNTTILEYEINFTVVPNTDASLQNILIDGVAIPEFSPDVFSYNYELPPNEVNFPEVVGVANDSNATVLVNDALELPGTTQIYVLAEDKITLSVYEVNFTVSANNDATLSSISVNDSLIPNFDPNVFIYNFRLSEGDTAVPLVTAVANDPNASVTVIDPAQVPDTTEIVVIAEDGISTNTYWVIIDINTGIVEPKPLDLKVYPNPVSEKLYIEINNFSGDAIEYAIFDLSGRLMYRNSRFDYMGRITVDMSGYTQGVYSIIVQSKDSAKSFKIIKR